MKKIDKQARAQRVALMMHIGDTSPQDLDRLTAIEHRHQARIEALWTLLGVVGIAVILLSRV